MIFTLVPLIFSAINHGIKPTRKQLVMSNNWSNPKSNMSLSGKRFHGSANVAPSAPFWPLLCPYGSASFAAFVNNGKELPQVVSLFIPGLYGAVLFNGQVLNTKVLALHCDFSSDICSVQMKLDVAPLLSLGCGEHY